MNWRRLFRYLRPYGIQIMLSIIFQTIYTAITLAFPLLTVQFLDSALNQKSIDQLNSTLLVIVALLAIQSLCDFFQTYSQTYVGEKLIFDLRTAFYEHIHSLSLDFHHSHRIDDLISRISNDVVQLRKLLVENITKLVYLIILFVGSIIVIVSLSLKLLVILCLCLLVLVIVVVALGQFAEQLSKRMQTDIAASTVIFGENLQNIEVVKSFTRENYESNRYLVALQKTFKVSMRLEIVRSGTSSLIMFSEFGMFVLALFFAGQEVLNGKLTLIALINFTIYGLVFGVSLGGLVGTYIQFKEFSGSIQRIFEIFDLRPTIIDAPNAQSLPSAATRVIFDHVSFSYDGQTPVLDDICLDIAPSEVIAFVGPSGAGKSTLFNLIMRFYDPTAGAIKLGDYDLRAVKLRDLRHQIGLVSQESFLFGGTIRENIAYGKLNCTQDEIIAAAKAANAHDFIMQMPDQYETVVGERGTKLSGGQRQRLAIARTVLRDTRILLLDEATSSLDSDSEQLVQSALNKLMEGRTTIIIAHRLTTIKNANRIVVLNHGKIEEIGNHAELLQQEGLYAKLYKTFEANSVHAPTLTGEG